MLDRMKGKIVPSGPTLLGLGGWVAINELDKMAEEKKHLVNKRRARIKRRLRINAGSIRQKFEINAGGV